MLEIHCPWCGPRAEIEFRCGGEGHIARPTPHHEVSDTAWANYLFYRENPKGVHFERWAHIHGCGQWFNIARDTVSHRVLAVYGIAETKPEINECRSPKWQAIG